MSEKDLFKELSTLVTESRNPNSYDVDIMSVEETVRLFNTEDKKVAEAVEKEIKVLERAKRMRAYR